VVGPGYPLDLPHAVRAATPFAVLSVLALLLLLVPDVPAWAAAVAAIAFALAAATRAAQQHRALLQLRSNLDRLLLRSEPTGLSPMLVWRAGELCATDEREHLATTLRRLERSADSSHMPGATPLNRSAVRASGEELGALVDRLSSPDPVNARGMIMVRRLLDDPAGPLYDRDRAADLGPRLREALRALDVHSRR
jgi:HAMP domain-containing protein